MAIWQLEEEKLELGKKMEQLLCEQDQLLGKQDQEQLLGKQDQEQLLGKQDQKDVDLKIKKVTFSDEALCKEVELGDHSLFDGGADDATKDAAVEEAAEEIVDISGGSIEQKAFSRHFYVGGLKKLNTVSRMFDVNFFQTLFILCQVAPSPVDMPTWDPSRQRTWTPKRCQSCIKRTLWAPRRMGSLITGMKGRSSKGCTRHVESSSLNTIKSKQWTKARSSQHKKFVRRMKVRRTTSDVPLGVMEVSHEAIDRDGLSNAGEEAPKKQFVIVKEREHAREKRLASQGRPKEGTRLKVMSRGGKFYSCSVVKTRFLAVKVHYIGWGEQFDEWVQFPSSKVKMDQ